MAEYFETRSIAVRVLCVVLALAFGIGIVAYILLWLLTPEEPSTV